MPDSNQEKLFENGPKDQDAVPGTDSDKLEETPEVSRAMSDPEFEKLESVLGPVEARRRLGLESDSGVPSESNPNQIEMVDDDSLPSGTQTAGEQPEKGEELYRHVIKKPEKPENAGENDDNIGYRFRTELLLYALTMYDVGEDEEGDLAFLEAFVNEGEELVDSEETKDSEAQLALFRKTYAGRDINSQDSRRIYSKKLRSSLIQSPGPAKAD